MRHMLLAAIGMIATAPAGAFELRSPDIAEGGNFAERFVFDGFGCTGGNISPSLAWNGAPDGTQSFALMMHDPDAPTGGAGFWHWIVLDIPASENGLPQGSGADNASLPSDAYHVPNDYGIAGYGGPCPPEPDGEHRYNFTLYALPVASLEVPAGASTAVTGFIVNATAIGTARLQGLYDR